VSALLTFGAGFAY